MSKTKNLKDEIFNEEPSSIDPIVSEEKVVAPKTEKKRSAEAIALREANKEAFEAQDKRESKKRTAACLAYRKLHPEAFPNG